MKVKFKLFILLIFIMNTLFCQKFIDSEDEYIIWDKDRKLQWEDFKAYPDSSSHIKAITEYGIRSIPYRVEGRLYFNVITLFYTDYSWTRNPTSNALLAHEQLHFDIAELCARKIRKNLSNLSDTLRYNTTYNYKLIDSIVTFVDDSIQDQYDKETRRGTKPIQQKEWEEKIWNELKELSEYEYVIEEPNSSSFERKR